MGRLILFGMGVTVLLVFGPYVLPLLLGLAAMVAFVVGAIEYATATISGFTPFGPIGHLRIDPPEQSDDGLDPAYVSYFAGPILLDYRQVLRRTYAQVWAKVVGSLDMNKVGQTRSLVHRVWLWVRDSLIWKLFTVPVGAAATLGLVAGAGIALGFVGVISVVFAVLLMLFVVGAVLTGGGSRLLELAVLFVRGITLECPTCHVRATRPVYQCPNDSCRATHRRLLPGRSGVLRRTCRCRQTLPTLLAGGKAKLAAFCAECSSPLPIKGLSAPTVHIPVVAGPQAGKSVFMQIAVSRLMLLGDGFEFADPMAMAEFEKNLKIGVTDDPKRALKTVVARPRAYNVFVGREGSLARRLLYLYDPAGEILESADQLAEAQFLRFTKGVVFVVDPFALRQVRSSIDRAMLGEVRASNTAPREVLERFRDSLRERMSTDKTGRIDLSVAVVVTKADGLLALSGVRHPYAGLEYADRETRSQAAQDWFADMGQRDIVSTLANNFTRVSYFVVSYQDAREVTRHESAGTAVFNDDPAQPLLWLLRRKER